MSDIRHMVSVSCWSLRGAKGKGGETGQTSEVTEYVKMEIEGGMESNV